jgi:hypothetical protein
MRPVVPIWMRSWTPTELNLMVCRTPRKFAGQDVSWSFFEMSGLSWWNRCMAFCTSLNDILSVNAPGLLSILMYLSWYLILLTIVIAIPASRSSAALFVAHHFVLSHDSWNSWFPQGWIAVHHWISCLCAPKKCVLAINKKPHGLPRAIFL